MLFGVNPLMFNVTPKKHGKGEGRHNMNAGTLQLTEKLGFFEQLLIL